LGLLLPFFIPLNYSKLLTKNGKGSRVASPYRTVKEQKPPQSAWLVAVYSAESEKGLR